MPKFLMAETIHSEKVITARLGTAADAAGRYTDAEVGKAVKLVAESRYALCAAGDAPEGFINSVAVGSYDGFSLGGVVATGYKDVVFSGATVVVGDYVVAGTVVAAGTKLTGPLAVAKAADQAIAKAAPYKWRVVSLGSAGTGVAGTTGLIERV